MKKVLEILIIVLLAAAFLTFKIESPGISANCAWISFVLFIGYLSILGEEEYGERH